MKYKRKIYIKEKKKKTSKKNKFLNKLENRSRRIVVEAENQLIDEMSLFSGSIEAWRWDRLDAEMLARSELQ